jgi:peptidoglycan/xylan/chitin deacetylase (PgdA/CDA1 family)
MRGERHRLGQGQLTTQRWRIGPLATIHHKTGPLRGRRASWLGLLALLIVLMPILAACGGDSDSGSTDISWQPGLPTQTAPAENPPASEPTATTEAGEQPTQPAEAPTPTTAAAPTTAANTPGDTGVTGRKLTDAELEQYQPNELGQIPILEYHQFTDNKDEVAQFVRLYDSFRDDLQWLYDNGYYVVSMKSVVENNIDAPAGKKPVVLTFDDSPVNQFRFIVGDDGSLTVDPNSAVGIMQDFYQQHPDFGRGGLFATLPQSCFFGGVDGTEDDQIDLCSQKVTFLLDNGYEVGNHTYDHQNLYDVDDDTFRSEIAEAIDALQGYDARVEANIFVVPNGDYPELDVHDQQRDWMQNGFTWNGKDYFLIASLMVGANPAPAPVSSDWDSMWIPRIQMCTCQDAGWDDAWQQNIENSPDLSYVSDGDPNTITIPNALDPVLEGTFDESKADGKEVVRY